MLIYMETIMCIKVQTVTFLVEMLMSFFYALLNDFIFCGKQISLVEHLSMSYKTVKDKAEICTFFFHILGNFEFESAT